MRAIRIFSVICLSFLTFVSSAWADIAAFNAAVKAGDFKTAAVEAKGAWASFDKTSAATATVAREFGFVSYMAGDYAAAREYGLFLREQGATLPTPDDQPETSAVLLRVAEYRINSKGPVREQLFDALKARVAASDVDNISVLASEAYYRTEWMTGAWARAKAGAELAAELLGRGGDFLGTRALEARMFAAAAGFLQSRSQGSYDRMAQVHDDIVDRLDATTDEKAREAVSDLMHQSGAWALAMTAAENWRTPTGTLLPLGIKERPLKAPQAAGAAADADMCKGRFETKGLQYPSSALFAGTVGAVLVRLDFDARGAVLAHKVLAAVPARHFAAGVEKAAPSIRLTRARDDKPGCRLDAKGRVLQIVFQIG